MNVDLDRLSAELAELATFSEVPAPAVTRVVYTPQDLQARAWFKKLCAEAGLVVREDAVGNTFARWPGTGDGAVGTGSHIDAIPNAGMFDGTVGVLGGLEAIRVLQRDGYRPRRSIELLLFTSEEPTRFGIGCLGSRLLSGTLPKTAGETLKGQDGLSLDQARHHAGFTGTLESVVLPHGYYDAFVELHIEQGPLLERQGLPLGVVTAIAAPATLRFAIEGEGGHAGAVLMPDRHDAFLAAAEIALAVEKAALTTGSIDTVGTVGLCQLFPGAVNSVPARATFTADIRDIDGARRDQVLRQVRQAAAEVAQRRGVKVEIETLNADPPAACDPKIITAFENAAKKHGLASQRMVSRAYHDSLFMARVAPVGMLFIPCRNGWSHRPDEFASPEDIGRGVLILAEALRELSA